MGPSRCKREMSLSLMSSLFSTAVPGSLDSLDPDVVLFEVEVGQHRPARLQSIGERLGSSSPVPTNFEMGQDRAAQGQMQALGCQMSRRCQCRAGRSRRAVNLRGSAPYCRQGLTQVPCPPSSSSFFDRLSEVKTSLPARANARPCLPPRRAHCTRGRARSRPRCRP